MIYKLTSIDPPRILTQSPVEGYPVVRKVGNPTEYSAPEGCRYLPVVEQPQPTPADGMSLRKLPDAVVGDEIHTNRFEEYPTPPTPVPEEVTPMQLRVALLDHGISPKQVRQSIEADERKLVRFEYANMVRRNHPMIAELAAGLGLSEAEVDQIFIDASQIEE